MDSPCHDTMRGPCSLCQLWTLSWHALHVCRAFKLHASYSGATVPANRSEQLKAAEEAIKQQRRQSRQQGAAGRQQGAAAGAGAGLLPAISEAGEERPAAGAGGRKRGGTAAGNAPPRSTRKRGRCGSAELGPLEQQQQWQEEGEAAATDATAKQADQQAPGGPQEAEAAQVEAVMADVVEQAAGAST